MLFFRLLFSEIFLNGHFIMAQQRFLFQLPFAIVGLFVMATALVYLSAIADVQSLLALQPTE